MAAPGTHFADAEFACPHCGVALVRPKLKEHLELVRHLIGDRPIRILSGYRCPVHNKEVSGAPNSQHMYAAAADIPEHLVTFKDAYGAGFTGIGTKGDWVVHMDVRDGALQHWTY